MVDLVGGAVLFLVAWTLGWKAVAGVVIAIAIVGGLITAVGWTVAELRTDGAFKFLDPEAPSNKPDPTARFSTTRMRVWPIGLAVLAGITYVRYPDARWLCVALGIAAVALFARAVRKTSSLRHRLVHQGPAR